MSGKVDSQRQSGRDQFDWARILEWEQHASAPGLDTGEIAGRRGAACQSRLNKESQNINFTSSSWTTRWMLGAGTVQPWPALVCPALRFALPSPGRPYFDPPSWSILLCVGSNLLTCSVNLPKGSAVGDLERPHVRWLTAHAPTASPACWRLLPTLASLFGQWAAGSGQWAVGSGQ